jgi:hypothetical protein
MIKHYKIPGSSSKLYFYLIILPCIFILYACPFSSTYKLDKEGSIYTESTLLGNWATMITTKKGKQLPVKMILSKKNDTEYSIAFTGYINDLLPYHVITNDTIKGTAFMSTIVGRKFMNVCIKEQTYIAEVILKDNKLSLLPLAEKFTAKYVLSNEELRLAVEIHVKTRISPVYDEQFCLKDMVRVN